MAKHSKKRKPQHHNPLKDAPQTARNQTQTSAQEPAKKVPLGIVGILSLVMMVVGIIVASFWHKSLGCLISMIGATVNLVYASIKKTQTLTTIILYLVYVAIIFYFLFR